MTNSDSHSMDMTPDSGPGRRRLSRRAATALKAMGAALVACVGFAFFASPAFAHANVIVGVTNCGPGVSVEITWTISNDYPASEVVTPVSWTSGASTPSPSTLDIASSPSTSNEQSGVMTQVIANPTTSSATLTVSGTWASNPVFTGQNTGTVQLPTTCGGTEVHKSVSPSTVTAGSSTPVVYTLAVTNTGGSPSAVVVTDTVPAGLTYVSSSCGSLTASSTPSCTAVEAGGTVTFTLVGIPGGATEDVTFSATANAGDPDEIIPNTAFYTGPGCTTAAPGCSSNTINVTVTNGSAVTVVKTDSASNVTAGQTTPLTYTLTVTNTSASSTTTSPVVVTDTVPAGLTYVSSSCGSLSGSSTPSCTASYDGTTDTVTFKLGAGIVAGASYAVTFDGTVDATDTTSIVNTAHYTGPGCTTASPGCPSTTVTTTVANLAVVKSDSAGTASVKPGQAVTYTLTVTNSGDGPGSLTVTDAAPAGTALTTPAPACPANATTSTCVVTVNGSDITWVITGMPGATSYALTYTVSVNADATGSIVNTGTYTDTGCTTAGGCSTNTTTNQVVPPTSPTSTPPATTPPATPPATPAPVTKSTSGSTPIAGATTVHTGEPWAGSGPYVLAVLSFGLALIGFGQLRRRKAIRRTHA